MDSKDRDPLAKKFSSAANALARYLKNNSILQEQAYYIGKRDAITQLAEFIMHDTNQNPSNASISRVLDYIREKQSQLETETTPNTANLNQTTYTSNHIDSNMQNTQVIGNTIETNHNTQGYNNQSANIQTQSDERMVDEQSQKKKVQNTSGNRNIEYFPNHFPNVSEFY